MMTRFTGGTIEERARVISEEPIGRMGRPDAGERHKPECDAILSKPTSRDATAETPGDRHSLPVSLSLGAGRESQRRAG
jgi:hypothetical protein